MTTIDLQGFGTTLAVGIYALAGVFAILVAYRPTIVRTIHNSVKTAKTLEAAALAIFFSASLLAIGIFAEDISNKFVDADSDGLGSLVVTREFTIREQAFKKKVGEELAATGRISRYLHDPQAREAASWYEQSPTDELWEGLSEDLREDVVNGLYYVAKNTLVKIEGVRNELATIKSRSDFSRSFALISVFLAFVSLLPATVLGLIRLTRWIRSLRSTPPAEPQGDQSPLANAPATTAPDTSWSASIPFRVSALCIAFLSIFLVTRTAFCAEEHEYDIRVFGYFATLDEGDLPTITFKAKNGHMMSSWFAQGISGMLRMSQEHLVVVHDTKDNADKKLPRVSLINMATGSTSKLCLFHEDKEILPSDLESIASIPGSSNQLLLCESGYYIGKTDDGKKLPPRNGRIFWAQCIPGEQKLQLLRTLQWPAGTQDIEATTCVKRHDGKIVLFAATRSGSISYSSDISSLDHGSTLDLTPIPAAIPQHLVQALQAAGTERLVCDFHLNGDTLWATAAHDPGDDTGNLGPFRSVIYPLAKITSGLPSPLEFSQSLDHAHYCEGVKVEGLAGGSGPDSILYGTDDESFGGIWRPLRLRPPSTQMTVRNQ